MRQQIFAGATALVLATAMTSGAMASDHRGASHHWRHGHRVVGVYGGQDTGTYYGGHYTSLGPLGFTLGPPPGRRTCGPNCVPGSSIAAWSY
jgi:hypothetical protein